MSKYKWSIILLDLAFLMTYINSSVAKKENLLKDGQLVLLELAPVDPRSLMQGDYMTLRYKISERINVENIPKRGFCVVRLDSNKVASSIRFRKGRSPLSMGEHLIGYTAPDRWNVNIGAESFFFQEGQSDKYAKAKYGAVKIDKQGHSLLVGLYDEQKRRIQ